MRQPKVMGGLGEGMMHRVMQRPRTGTLWPPPRRDRLEGDFATQRVDYAA
jgi:hypothetical protein